MHEEIQITNKHVVFLGEAGFPPGLAAVQRMTLMAKALLHVGCKVTVICRKGVWRKNEQIEFGIAGSYEGIDYRYTSIDGYRPKGFIHRNLEKLKGMYTEFVLLKHLKMNELI